nr:hypothetical protein [Lachnospiraceae bacterium]
MKTRIISLLLAAVLTVALAGCGKIQKAETQTSGTGAAVVQSTTAVQAAEKQSNTSKIDPAAAKTIDPAAKQTTEPAAQQATDPAAKQAGSSNTRTDGEDPLPEVFRLETEDFILIITGIADGTDHPFFGDYYEFRYTFENKTDKRVMMDWGFIAVCHCVMPQGVCEWAEPGETVNGGFDLMKVFLENYGIESPDEVVFGLEITEDGNEDADPIFKQYQTFYPTGKTAADIPPLSHTPVEGEIVLADTDEFSFILLPGQYDGGLETVFEVLAINKTGGEMRFKWRDIFSNGIYAGGHDTDNFINGTVLAPYSQEKEYLYVETGALMHIGNMSVDHLEFTLDVFDRSVVGQETKIYSAPLEAYPTGLAPQDVVVPVCPEMPEQKVLFENEDITVIILDEFQGGHGVRYLTVYIENRSDKDASVLLHDIMIDEQEGHYDQSFFAPAGQKSVMLINLDFVLPQENDPERGTEDIVFQLDIRLTDAENNGTDLVKDAECEIRFTEIPLEERLQEDDPEPRYESAP